MSRIGLFAEVGLARRPDGEIAVTTKAFVVWTLLATGVMLSGRIAAQNSNATDDPAVSSYLDAIPADLRADKDQVIREAMHFSDKDAAAFWPVYKMYAAELAKLEDERMQLVKSYADKWTTLSDIEARDMARKSLQLESRRADLRNQYFDRFNKVLPGLTVAKFFQLEHRLDLLVDLKIASELPSLLVRSADTPGEVRQPTPK
jgi:hypothetical protein